MDFKNLVKTRESCRAYQDKDIDKELLETILKEAVNAPSACNSQPWKLVACTGETAKKLPEIIISEELKINMWTPQVPVFVVICETKAKLMSSLKCDSQHYAAFDLGAVSSSLCYSSADYGVASCIIGVFDDAKLKELLNIPSDTVIRAIIALGYAKDSTPRDKFRKNIDEVISFNQW